MTSWLKGLVPFLAMVELGFLLVGLTTLGKAAMSKGLSPLVSVAYSNAIATVLFLLSFSKGKRDHSLNLSLLCKFFLLSLVGMTVLQTCTLVGVNYSSPTLSSAVSSLTSAITFMLAVFFRMEKLDHRNSKGQIKVIGTSVSISGALIVTIYKGHAILVPKSQSNQNTSPSPNLSSLMHLMGASDWIIGGLLFLGADLGLAIWNIGQAAVLKGYQSQKTILFFFYLFGTLQCATLTLALERDPNAWILTHDIELISVLYSAVIGNVASYSVITWCIDKKGPVFVVMFKPLGIAIAAFMGTIFLGDTLYTRSVVGAFLIVMGFYGVIWAKSEEGKVESHGVVDELQSPLLSPQTPLLESHRPV